MSRLAAVRDRYERLAVRAASTADGAGDRLGAWGRARWTTWEESPFVRTTTPRIMLGILLVWYTIVFGNLVWLRHSHYGTFDYDLGMYDQAVWLLSRGRGFMTVRGMHVFGHHANLGYLLFVPFYWLGAGSQFLDIVNTLGVVACAVPVFLLARKGLRSDWAGLLAAGAYLFHFIPQWMIHETFHPENLAAPGLLFAFWFASERRWTAYWWCVAFALIWKEDVGLYVAMMGVVLLLLFRARRMAVWTFGVGLAWFLFATQVIIRLFSPEGAVFDSLFGPLGTSATDVVRTAVTHPTMVGRTLGEHGAEAGALRMIRPFGYTAFGAPVALLMGLPQHIVNFLSVQSFTWDPRTHYFMLPFTSVTIASVRAITTRRRVLVSWALLGVMVLGVVSTQEQGVAPWTTNGAAGYWPADETPRTKAIDRVIARVPDDAVVSTNSVFVPHLAHRPEVYTFPNPWKSSNFGPGSKPGRRSPDRVEWMFIDRQALTGEDATLFTEILASNDFRIVELADPGLYLLERVESG